MECCYCEETPCACDSYAARDAHDARCLSVFDYAAQPMEVVGCNLCGEHLAGPKEVEARCDRYGFPQKADRCLQCGLVYLNPRMTKEAYARFYADGTYRKLVSAYHGREINAQTIQPEQLVYATELAEFIGPFIGSAKTLLDVGGSTGVVAGYLSGKFGLKATVLDPAPEELAEAQGLETIQASVEDWEPNGRTWDVITLCQTVDHLLDIAGTLRKLKGCLAPSRAYLFVDVVDYDKTRTIKIDHPYNLTRETMSRYLQQVAGLAITAQGRSPDGIHRRFLAR